LSSVSYEAWMQAQQSVLGSVLIDDRCASFLVFGLAEEDFCESYRSLYRAIRELYTTGKPVDPVAVLNVVGDSYKDFIVQLMKLAFDGARQQFRFIGKGQQPLKPFDYSSYVMPSQVDQYPQLCMDVETPFDAEQK